MMNEDKDSFESVAKDLGCDESDDALDKAMEMLKIQQDNEKDSEEREKK